ncbi:MAG: low molecular weight protein-tyrosine-phosphatase [Rubrivivax sp.]
MVCMGNICRSPTAEAVLRSKLRAAGLQRAVAVDSAGTIDHHRGEPPDPRAIRHAARRGYDLSALRARAVEPADYLRFQWMLAMDEDNLRLLRRQQPPDSAARLALLLEHAPQLGQIEVPDPYYGAPAGFERVLDLVEAACDGLVERLARELGGAAAAGDRPPA